MGSLELGPAPREGLLGPLWELLFPSRCLGCRRVGQVLCPECLPRLPWLPAEVCPRCARRSPAGGVCRRCANGGSPYLASTRAACVFDGVIRTAIHQLKYRGASSLAPFLASVLGATLERRPLDADLLVPVPLHPRRQRERGFNQADLIADRLAEISDLPLPTRGLLERTELRPPQVGLNAAARRHNVRGAFDCRLPDLVRGQRVLLVDDVMTTGATLEACAEALTAAGAARVLALVVARES